MQSADAEEGSVQTISGRTAMSRSHAIARKMLGTSLLTGLFLVSAVLGCKSQEPFKQAQTPQHYSEYGRYWLAQGDYRRARVLFGTALATDPKHAEALLGLGQAERQLAAMARQKKDAREMNQHYAAAISSLRRLISLEPDNADAYCWLGQIYFEGGDPSRAAELLAKARDLTPQRALFRRWLMLACSHAGRYREAKEEALAYRTMVARKPEQSLTRSERRWRQEEQYWIDQLVAFCDQQIAGGDRPSDLPAKVPSPPEESSVSSAPETPASAGTPVP